MSDINNALHEYQYFPVENVESVVRTVCVSYALFRSSYIKKFGEISYLLDRGDVTQVVQVMISVFNIPSGCIKKVGYKATNISGLAEMHMTLVDGSLQKGVLLFRESKEQLLDLPKYLLVHIIAHELSHYRLRLDQHQWLWSDFATDILALLITGNSRDWVACTETAHGSYGYIRPELHDKVFRCLERYSQVIYLSC